MPLGRAVSATSLEHVWTIRRVQAAVCALGTGAQRDIGRLDLGSMTYAAKIGRMECNHATRCRCSRIAIGRVLTALFVDGTPLCHNDVGVMSRKLRAWSCDASWEPTRCMCVLGQSLKAGSSAYALG